MKVSKGLNHDELMRKIIMLSRCLAGEVSHLLSVGTTRIGHKEIIQLRILMDGGSNFDIELRKSKLFFQMYHLNFLVQDVAYTKVNRKRLYFLFIFL